MATVDVVLPVGPGPAPYLHASIRSILAQAEIDLILHVFLDGPNPAVEANLAEYRDDRLIVRTLPHLGLTSVLNEALELTSATYWARMDADDIAEAGRLVAQVSFLEQHPSVAAISCSYTIIDSRGQQIGTRTLPTASDAIRAAMAWYNPLIHPGATLRRSCLVAVGGYDESFQVAQDRDLWFRLAARYDLANLPEFLMQIRLAANQVSARHRRAQRWAAARAIVRGTRLGVCKPVIGYLSALRHVAALMKPE